MFFLPEIKRAQPAKNDKHNTQKPNSERSLVHFSGIFPKKIDEYREGACDEKPDDESVDHRLARQHQSFDQFRDQDDADHNAGSENDHIHDGIPDQREIEGEDPFHEITGEFE